jgi:glycosyltransferase involved in cell wall biosynthesis
MIRLHKLLSSRNIQTVNCHYVGETAITWVMAKKLGIFNGKVLLSFHGTDVQHLSALNGIRRMGMMWALRNADHLVAPSHNLASLLQKNFALPDGKVTVVHNGVDAHAIRSKAGRTASLAPPGRSIVCIGTFDPVKGHDVLVTAFSRIAPGLPDVRLVIAGRDGPTLNSTREQIEALGLSSRIELVVNASHEQALGLMASAEVVAVPSRREGLPLVALRQADRRIIGRRNPGNNPRLQGRTAGAV